MKWHLRLVIFILSLSAAAWAQESENEAAQEPTLEATAAPSAPANNGLPAEASEDLSLESSAVPTAETAAEPPVDPAAEKSTPEDELSATAADIPAEPTPETSFEPATAEAAAPSSTPFAEKEPGRAELNGSTGLVEIQYPDDYQGPYLENRGTHGFMFDIGYQSYIPKSMLSSFDQGTYKAIYGNDPIQLVEAQLAYKYNFSLGSLTLGLGYGTGRTNSNVSTVERTISITKPSLSAGYIMDALFEEPYIAPYGQIQAWQMNIKEERGSTEIATESRTTQVGFAYTIGALIQLNWLDETAAENGAHNFGLDNTYLDLFAVKYSKTQGATDANTESDFSFGAGLRLEY